ncbi:hypothetical protein OIV83_004430 [Microbotryomycetes sp. JL201]|nr:hypothetical protein OIV83_004430 [Microbotryomycetes sp. JL201]
MKAFALLSALAAVVPATVLGGYVTVDPNNLPARTEDGQVGYNDCYKRYKGKDGPDRMCQTLWLGQAEDFCVFAPRTRVPVGTGEREAVAYCTKKGHGARLIPKGTFKGMRWVRTSKYIQITAVGDFTKINVPAGDEGGELDAHGADGLGNPIGGIVIAKNNAGQRVQIYEWAEFLAYNELSLRACFPGSDAKRYCPHVYDVMGSQWNHPGKYSSGFDSCNSKPSTLPPGVYSKNGGLSTWYQGQNPTPPAGPAPSVSNCRSVTSLGVNY